MSITKGSRVRLTGTTRRQPPRHSGRVFDLVWEKGATGTVYDVADWSALGGPNLTYVRMDTPPTIKHVVVIQYDPPGSGVGHHVALPIQHPYAPGTLRGKKSVAVYQREFEPAHDRSCICLTCTHLGGPMIGDGQ